MKTVNIYTDGACSGNQNESNIGGWGAVLEYQENIKELFGGTKDTTNNIMELTGVIEGLKCLNSKSLSINIFSDSAYIVNCINDKWYAKWRVNGWISSKKEPVENKELWEELIDLVESFDRVNFYKVKGHLNIDNQTEMKKWHTKYKEKYPNDSFEYFIHLTNMNNKADELANKGMSSLK